MKKNIGNVLALYPTPAVVVGTEVNGKVNWLLGKDVSGMLFLFMACPAPRFSLSSSSKRIIRYENSYNHSAGIATRPYCRL